METMPFEATQVAAAYVSPSPEKAKTTEPPKQNETVHGSPPPLQDKQQPQHSAGQESSPSKRGTGSPSLPSPPNSMADVLENKVRKIHQEQ